jgi:hypothetical protein
VTRLSWCLTPTLFARERQPFGMATQVYDAIQQAQENLRLRKAERDDARALEGDDLIEAIGRLAR